MMSREELVEKYRQISETAQEKSLEWYAYGEGFALLEGGAPSAFTITNALTRG
jgi:hypothetical protein